MTINSDGTVSACCSDWNQQLIIGNINENSLKEIWESEKLKILQKLHLLKKEIHIPLAQHVITQTQHKLIKLIIMRKKYFL